MSNLLRKAKGEIKNDITGKFESFNLLENPFPFNPFVNKGSNDQRHNGSIYESKIREKEHNAIINNFIKVPQNDLNHIRLGYILDNSYVGRGNGKSAFTLKLIDEINEEYCLDISDDINKCFGLHISPEPSGRTKTFYDFVDLIFYSIIEKGLIDYCLASLRLDAIISLYDNFNVVDEFQGDDDLIEKLNNHLWFSNKEISISAITQHIYKNSILSKVGADFPLNGDKSNINGLRIRTKDDFFKYYEGLKKGKDRCSFVFHDLVLFFLSGGFNGAYLIVDDFERIPDFQSEKQKQEFALEIRTNFFDGIIENAKIGFYNLILVLHAGVPRLIEKSWSVSGMDRRSPLLNEGNVIAKHIINFDKLTHDNARLLLETYLDKYRIDPNNKNGIYPFTDEAIKIIAERAELNASSILQKANSIIEDAVNTSITLIDESFVLDKLGKSKNDLIEEIDDISAEDSENLFDKSKKK